jgi:cytochrome c oxidase subunit 2
VSDLPVRWTIRPATLVGRAAGRAVLICGALSLTVAGCSPAAPSPLDPRTGAAAQIAALGWIMIALATAVCIAAGAALSAALVVSRRRAIAEPGPTSPQVAADVSGDGTIIVAGMVLPAVILAFTLGYTIYTLREVAGVGGAAGVSGPNAHANHAPPSASSLGASDGARLDVRVTGQQWWWQVAYTAEQVVTANELHVPAGVPVRLTVTSDDVIHSFWVPQVAGKVDVIPGRVNTMTIQVDQPGTYRGMCSEFCGLQHAHMHLFLVVEPSEQFAAWVASQRQQPPALSDAVALQGQQLYQRACAECHAVQGAGAAGGRGPDLTHVASRRTLGAGMHENTRTSLSGWVTDPQGMKPGNLMPRPDLTDAEAQAVVTYLETLK